MGGAGSGRWSHYDKKRTVEDCWVLGISEVTRVIDLSGAESTLCTLRPIVPKTGERMSPLRCAPNVGVDGSPLLGLSYAVTDGWGPEHSVEQAVRLQTTRPNFGGVRWWFSCPRMVDDEECGRRVGTLYRSAEGRRFACRRCLDLTYESCQKSHRYDGLFAMMAGKASGEAFENLKWHFLSQTKEARRRRAEPSPTLLNAFDEVFGKGRSH